MEEYQVENMIDQALLSLKYDLKDDIGDLRNQIEALQDRMNRQESLFLDYEKIEEKLNRSKKEIK